MSFVYILAAVICGIGAVITAIRLFGSKKKQVSKSLENNIS
jgi:predicted ABC-type sugar transport system permease subunit